jgi:rhodanese-related sulfurtransferase
MKCSPRPVPGCGVSTRWRPPPRPRQAPGWSTPADGAIPGAIIIERNHLEWRLDPASRWRIPEATDHDVIWIIMCDEGYSSSLAAASLQLLGLHRATDLIGGFQAWRSAGLPVLAPQAAREIGVFPG